MTRRSVLIFLASQVAAIRRAFPQSLRALVTPSELPSPDRSAEQAAWVVLNQGVEDGDAERRKKATTALAEIGPVSEAVRIVEKGLDDKDTSVRQAAAAALGEMGARDAIPRLRAALDDSPEVCFTATKALWDLGDASSREIFQEVIEDERKDAPGKMRSAMRDSKRKLHPPQLALMGAKEAAQLFGPVCMAVDAVAGAVKETKNDSGAPGRAVAAGILARDSDPYALTLLEWALDDNSPLVRVAVAQALGTRGNQETIAKLALRFTDDRQAVRYMAAASIIKLTAKKAGAT